MSVESDSISRRSNRLASRLGRVLIEGLFVVNLAFSFFLFLSLSSYHSGDPSWSYLGAITDINNAGGRLGAWLSDILYFLFGYVAYLFPVMLICRAWLFFKRKTEVREFDWIGLTVFIIGLILVFISACGLLTIQTLNLPSNLPQGFGGYLGRLLEEEFVDSFGLSGARLLLVSLLFIALNFTMQISWLSLIENIGKLCIVGVPSVFLWINTRLSRIIQAKKAKKEAGITSKKRAVQFQKELINQNNKKPPIIKLPKKDKNNTPSKRVIEEKQVKLFDSPSELPEISQLLNAPSNVKQGYSKETLEKLSRLLELKLLDFKVEATVTDVYPGPVVTRFEIQPSAGTKVSTITNLAKDIARSLAVVSVRVVDVIPGKSVIGIEIPNEDRDTVFFSEVISSRIFDEAKSPLTLALGKDIGGQPIISDLAKMPHLLVAGTTGSGKSVGVNAMILSLLFKATPDQVRLILIDPKMLELSVYEDIPHLLTPVVTDMKDAANALRWCVGEMERRYKLMSLLGVRNIAGYNKKIIDAEKQQTPIADPLWQADELLDNTQSAPSLEQLPFIVIVIDEFADMMMVVGKKVEELIARIAQKARAAGIHLILATQRPSVDVITGLIKANIPSRIAFQVSSKIDSRTILDQGGAEQLLGHGDMLLLPPGSSVLTRVHGAFVDDDEVHRVAAEWKAKGQPQYIDSLTEEGGNIELPGMPQETDPDSEADALYDEAVAFVCETRKASISSVQRKLRIGYNRAARMIEAMEAAGVVSPMSSSGQREVLAPPPVK